MNTGRRRRMVNRKEIRRKSRRYSCLVLPPLAIALILSFMSEYFLTPVNLGNLLLQMTSTAIAAMGITFIMIAGEYDLSCAAVLAFTAVLSASLAVRSPFGAVLGIPFALALGAGIGFLNGWLISKFSIPSLVVTLAAMKIWRGVALWLTGGRTVSGLPEVYCFPGCARLFGVVPVSLIILAVLYIAGQLMLSRTRYGYEIYAVGRDAEAATLSGLDVKKIRRNVYIVGGILYAIAGLLMAGRVGAALPAAADSMEFTAMSAVIIGGCALGGGRGSLVGTFLGVLTMSLLDNGADLLQLSYYWISIVQGVIILAALVIKTQGVQKKTKTDRESA